MAGLFPPPQRSAIKSVQRGLSQIDDGQHSKVVTISTINTAKAVVSVCYSGGYSASGNTVGIGGYISSASAIRVERFGLPSPAIPFSWEVVEYE